MAGSRKPPWSSKHLPPHSRHPVKHFRGRKRGVLPERIETEPILREKVLLSTEDSQDMAKGNTSHRSWQDSYKLWCAVDDVQRKGVLWVGKNADAGKPGDGQGLSKVIEHPRLDGRKDLSM